MQCFHLAYTIEHSSLIGWKVIYVLRNISSKDSEDKNIGKDTGSIVKDTKEG